MNPFLATLVAALLSLVAVTAGGAVAPSGEDERVKMEGEFCLPFGEAEVPVLDLELPVECYFSPRVLRVPVGALVEFENEAMVAPHGAATHPDAPAPFDTGELGPGDSYYHTFTVPGTYRYYCTVHGPQMDEGVIVVT